MKLKLYKRLIFVFFFMEWTTISDEADVLSFFIGHFATNLLPVNWAPHTNQFYSSLPPDQLVLLEAINSWNIEK